MNSGGTLGGTGVIAPTVADAVIVNPGGTIRGGIPLGAPGVTNPLGVLTVSGTVTNTVTLKGAPSNGATLAVDFNSATPTLTGPPTAATTSLLAMTSGTLNFDTAITGTGPIVVSLVNDGGLALGTTYRAIIATNSGAGFALNGTPVTTSYTLNNDFIVKSDSFATFTDVSLNVQGNNLVLNFTTPVPESKALLGIAAMGLGVYRWGRRRLGKSEIFATAA